MLRLLCVVLLTNTCSSCSNFLMPKPNPYALSVRTQDDGPLPPGRAWGIVNVPQGNMSTRYGAMLFTCFNGSGYPAPSALPTVTGGLNEAGLSCDSQTMLHTVYPPKTNSSRDLDVRQFCGWALLNFGSVLEVKAALERGDVVVWGTTQPDSGTHFSLRDAHQRSIVVEFVDGLTAVHLDGNDNGITGFGVMTNQPPWPWHVQNVKHYRWKESLARPAVALPGGFYPDERFIRVSMLKAALPNPETYQQAIAQAVGVLNSVTVPVGDQASAGSVMGRLHGPK